MFKSINPGTMPLATDVNQIVKALQGTADIGSLILAGQATAPLAPSLSSGTSGVLNGTYKYQLVYITGWTDSYGNQYVTGFAPGAEASATVTNLAINVTIPTFSAPIIAVAVYRTAASGASGTEKYVGIVTFNGGTTFIDNIADAFLGTGMPTSASTPAFYGTLVPASVPTTNSTGTCLILGGGSLPTNTFRPLFLASPNQKGVGLDTYGNLLPSNPSQITSGNSWGVIDKNNSAVLTVYLDGSTSPAVVSSKGYGGLGRISAYSYTVTGLASGSSITITHNLGYAPIVAPFGYLGNYQLTFFNNSGYLSTVFENYNSGGNAWSGTIYFF